MRRLIAAALLSALAWLWPSPAWAAAVVTYTLNAITDVQPGAAASVSITLKNDSAAGSDATFSMSALENMSVTLTYDTRYFTFQQSYRSTYAGSTATLTLDATTNVVLGTLTASPTAPETSHRIAVGLSLSGQAVAVNSVNAQQVAVATPPSEPTGTAFAAIIDGGFVPTAGQWKNVTNSRLDTWTDGCDGTPGDKQGTPCQGSGTQIFVTNAEANAIDSGIWGTQGSSALLEVWTGAAYDPERHVMFLHGGGHFAYEGNEVYSLDLDTLTLKRNTDPYPLTLTTPGGDSHPSKGIRAEHTYSAITYAPSTNEVWITMAGAQTTDDETIPGIWDASTGDYIPNAEVLASFAWNTFGHTYSSSCYNDDDGKIYLFQMRNALGDVRRIDPVARTVTTLQSNQLGFEDNGGIVCYGNAAYMITSEGGRLRLRRYNVSSNTYTTLTDSNAGNMPGIPKQSGCDARPISNELVCWNGGNTIYRYNIAANTWSTVTPGGASVPSDPFSGEARVFTKWKYLEAIDSFVGINQDNGSNAGLWLYRTPDSTWTAGSMTAFAFASKCARPGVIQCVDFDDVGDFSDGCSGGTLYQAGSPACPTVTETLARDTTVKASGAASAKCTVSTGDSSDVCGSYTVNFTPGTLSNGASGSYPDQFGAGEEFWVQVKMRYSTGYVTFKITGQGFTGNGSCAPESCGDKLFIITEGDRPGANNHSCEELEVVPTDNAQRGVMQAYHRCGSPINFETAMGGSDFDLQPPNACSYQALGSDPTLYDDPPCTPQVEDLWMTITVQMIIGSWGSANSTIRVWQQNEGSSTKKLVLQRTNFTLNNSDPSNAKYGAIWLTPYNTGKRSDQSHPTFFIWYDDLVISRAPIN